MKKARDKKIMSIYKRMKVEKKIPDDCWLLIVDYLTQYDIFNTCLVNKDIHYAIKHIIYAITQFVNQRAKHYEIIIRVDDNELTLNQIFPVDKDINNNDALGVFYTKEPYGISDFSYGYKEKIITFLNENDELKDGDVLHVHGKFNGTSVCSDYLIMRPNIIYYSDMCPVIPYIFSLEKFPLMYWINTGTLYCTKLVELNLKMTETNLHSLYWTRSQFNGIEFNVVYKFWAETRRGHSDNYYEGRIQGNFSF
jgi:hypothetical protein